MINTFMLARYNTAGLNNDFGNNVGRLISSLYQSKLCHSLQFGTCVWIKLEAL